MKIHPSIATSARQLLSATAGETARLGNGAEKSQKLERLIASAHNPAGLAMKAAELRGQPVDAPRQGDLGTNQPQTADFTPAPDDPPLTVEGLMEDWGKKGSMYDLDGSGIVDMQDLVALLAQLEQSSETISKPGAVTDPSALGLDSPLMPDAPSDDEPAESPQLTVKGLMEAFGSKGGDYDLDGNGIVDMDDLTRLLAKLSGDAQPPAAPVDPATGDGNLPAGLANESPVDPGTPASSGDPVQDLIDSWGEKDSAFDIDGDGQVSMDDLLQMLARLANNPSQPGEAAAPATGNGSLPSQLADSLVDRFRGQGFETHPPANVHDIVKDLGLDQENEKSLLGEVASRYPKGLGVNFVG